MLRTTLITGFPGETQEDHEELMEFVDEMEFDRLGVFTYSAGGGYPGSDYGRSGSGGSQRRQTR